MNRRDAWGLRAELEQLSASSSSGLSLSDPHTRWILEQLAELEASSPLVEPRSAEALPGRDCGRNAVPGGGVQDPERSCALGGGQVVTWPAGERRRADRPTYLRLLR